MKCVRWVVREGNVLFIRRRCVVCKRHVNPFRPQCEMCS